MPLDERDFQASRLHEGPDDDSNGGVTLLRLAAAVKMQNFAQSYRRDPVPPSLSRLEMVLTLLPSQSVS